MRISQRNRNRIMETEGKKSRDTALCGLNHFMMKFKVLKIFISHFNFFLSIYKIGTTKN